MWIRCVKEWKNYELSTASGVKKKACVYPLNCYEVFNAFYTKIERKKLSTYSLLL